MSDELNLADESNPPKAEPVPLSGPERRWNRFLKIWAWYFSLCFVLGPLSNSIWLGDLPLLAIIQVPKIYLLERVQIDVVMKVVWATGRSSGSFSPDYRKARTPALILTYAVTIGAAISLALWRTRMAKSTIRLSCMVLAAGIADFSLMVFFYFLKGYRL